MNSIILSRSKGPHKFQAIREVQQLSLIRSSPRGWGKDNNEDEEKEH